MGSNMQSQMSKSMLIGYGIKNDAIKCSITTDLIIYAMM